MGAMHGKVRIGISGWTYPPWRGKFYPAKLPQKQELAYAAGQFPTIEINGTFYSLQRPSSYDTWASQTPGDFVFSVKGSRFITHIRRLREGTEQALTNLYASGLLKLGPKLGPMLWQFPPNFPFDPEHLEAFLQLLPQDTHAAMQLAANHDGRLSGERVWLGDAHAKKQQLRHAIEIRNKSFVEERFIALLRQYNVALVCADTVEWPRLMDLTADFVYCRLHGSEQLYTSGYSDEALDTWADRVATWARGGEVIEGDHASQKPGRKRAARDVFVYFDNDVKVYAPKDARTLRDKTEHLLRTAEK